MGIVIAIRLFILILVLAGAPVEIIKNFFKSGVYRKDGRIMKGEINYDIYQTYQHRSSRPWFP